MTTKPVTDPCESCGLSTSPGSSRFVNRISTDSGWGCALCYEQIGWQDLDETWCHICAEEYDPQQNLVEPLYAGDVKTYTRCCECGWVIHDWDGIERGTA
jgi:hypothetical protein